MFQNAVIRFPPRRKRQRDDKADLNFLLPRFSSSSLDSFAFCLVSLETGNGGSNRADPRPQPRFLLLDPSRGKKCHLQNSKLQIMGKLEPSLISDVIGQKWAEGRRVG